MCGKDMSGAIKLVCGIELSILCQCCSDYLYCFVRLVTLIQKLTFLFSALNSNGSDALFSGVSRC